MYSIGENNAKTCQSNHSSWTDVVDGREKHVNPRPVE